MARLLSQAPLAHQPGTVFDYGFSVDVLARLVEVISGQPLDQFVQQRVFDPLEMHDTGYFVPEAKWPRLATLYTMNTNKGLCPVTSALQASYRQKPKLFEGGAGLTSTAMDYARFCQMLLNGGQLGGVRILSPKTVELMRADHLGDLPRAGGQLPPGYGFGLTFMVNLGPGRTGTIGSEGEYGWSGGAGTRFCIDPKEQLVIVFMTQVMGSNLSNLRQSVPTTRVPGNRGMTSAGRFFECCALRTSPTNAKRGTLTD